jgi:ferredoxin
MKVKFIPQNVEFDVTPEKSLLQIATENHIEIKSICKGVPSCAECRVRVVEGENNVLPPNKAELSLIGTNWRIDSRRLSCQMRCFGDVTVDLTEQLARQENQSKKVRGFRSQKQKESQAVQDTILLTEKPVEGAAQELRPTQQRPQRQQQGKQQNQKQKTSNSQPKQQAKTQDRNQKPNPKK